MVERTIAVAALSLSRVMGAYSAAAHFVKRPPEFPHPRSQHRQNHRAGMSS